MGRSKKVFEPQDHSANLGFEEQLWAAADKLRGQMDAAEYKHVILGLIFLKDIADGSEQPERFCLPELARWSYIRAQAKTPAIGEVINGAMAGIEQANPCLQGVLPQNYARASLDQRRLGELVALIDTLPLRDSQKRSQDILGRVYEYFLARFASGDGKAGEFYTPQSVVKLLVEMIQPYRGIVYDPCCGSGGMFVQSERFVQAHGGKAEDLSIYGQESNVTSWRLGKMNLALHQLQGNMGSQAADTFHHDLHVGLKADYILANPPFNLGDWGREYLEHDPRWQYGIPPANNANFAWVEHMIAHLAPNGLAGFILSNGSLSHGQGDGAIRKALIEADLVDCIVALPTQLFYTTQIATCLWVIAQNKQDQRWRDRRGETLFIYAYSLGKMVDRTHCTLPETDIGKIAQTYQNWRSRDLGASYRDIPGFCKSATLEEVRSHKMSLVPGRYVGFEQELTPPWNREQLQAELADVAARLQEITQASQAAFQVLQELLRG